MKRRSTKTLRVVYELATVDPADKEKVQQELDRAFDVLFEATLATELAMEQPSKIAKQNEASSPSKSPVDNSAQLGIQ